MPDLKSPSADTAVRKLTMAQLGCGYWGPNLVRNFVEAPGRNHFDVVLELGQPGTPLYRAVVELMGL